MGRRSSRFRAWAAGQRGQDAAEYALLIGLIAVAIIGAVTAAGDDLAAIFTWIAAQFPG